MDVNVADLIPEEQVDSSHGAPELIRAPDANNAPTDDGLTRLQSLAPSLAPKQVDVSNINPSDLVPEEQHIPEEATRKLAEYREDPSRHPLTFSELSELQIAAQHGQGWHERAVQGVSNMFSHLKDAAHGFGQQITSAIDNGRASRDQLLDKLGSDVSLSDKAKAVAGFIGGAYRDTAVGAAKGVFGLAPLAVDLTGAAVQAMPIWPVISHFDPSIEQNTDAFINSIGDVAHAGVSDLANKVNSATGADSKSIPYVVAENVAPLIAGAGPLEDISQAATKLAARAPRIIDSATAALAKGASKAAPSIGAVAGGLPGAVTAAMLPHGIGHFVPELIGDFLFAGTRPGRAIKNAVTSVIQSTADEVAASATVASQAPEGVTGLEAIAQNTAKEAETSLQRAKTLKDKLSPDEQAMLDEKVAGTDEPLFPDGHDALSKAQQKVRAEETKASDLGDKATIMSDRVRFAQYKEDLTRYLAGLGLHSAEGAAIGGALGGVSAPTGDKEAAASGALLGAALGAAGAGLKLPTDIRNSIRAANNFDLVRRAVQLDPDHPLYADNRKALNELTPEAKRYVMSYAGLAKPGGKQLIVLDPDTLLKTVNAEQAAKGETPISAAPNGYVGDNIYVNKDALNSGVVPHEVTHATGIDSDPRVVAAINEMMASSDPDVVAKRDAALARYEGAMQKIDPTFKLDPTTMQQETAAALGAEIMREIPPSALYGGRSTAQALSNWFANKFGGKEVKTTDQFGFPVTPEMRSAVQDALFDLGKKAAGQEPESLVRPQPATVAPAKTTPVITPPVIDGAAQALNAVGYNKNEAQKAAEFATSQLQSETGKIPTEEEVVRRALANKNRTSAVAASVAGGTAAQGNTATITPIQELVRPAPAMPNESGQGNLSAVSKEPTPDQVAQVHRDIEAGKITGPEDLPQFMPSDSPSNSRDKLVGPAIQLPDGMIIRQPTHDAALKAADAAGLDVDKAKLGFVTRSGKFLEQGRYTDDALNWGQEIGQIPEDVTSLTDHSFNNGLGNVRQFMPRQDDLGFYSKLEQTIEDKMPNKASADQIRGIITNAGVKPEEVAWSGFDDFLKENPSATKQQALDYLRDNNVQVREVVKGGTGDINEADLADRIKNGVRMRSGMHGFDGTEAAREILDSSDPSSIIVIESALSNHGIPNKAARQIAEDIQKQLSLGGTKFHQYQLPGANEGSYRELLLTLPDSKANKATATRTPSADESGYAPAWTITHRDGTTYTVHAPNEAHALRLAAHDKQANAGNFVSSHFDEPNILAHVRFNDRTGPNGEKILHLEEVQSDWHQKGRKEGYRTDENTTLGIQIKNQELSELANRIEAAKDQGQDPTPLRQQYDSVMHERDRLADEERSNKPPDAPFKTTWPNLALKRMIRYAAENGYDAISWTNGEQQAARYDLSKHVEAIRYDPDRLDLQAWAKGAPDDSEPIIDKRNVKPEQLPDIIGKEAAEKLLKTPSDLGTAHFLKGEDLKVGGEGMKGFYDKILPSVANDLGKKFGARVGTIELPISERKPRYSATQDGVLDSETGRIVEHADEGADHGEVEDMAAQWNRDNSHATEDEPAHNAKVWSLPITDAMRKSVMEAGQPRFMPDEIGSTPRGANEETRDLSGISAPKLAPATESDRAVAIDADNLDWVRRYFELDDKELTGKLSPHERTEMNRLYDKALQQYGSYNEFYRQNERYQPEDPNAPRRFMPDEDTQKQAERLGLSYQGDMQHKGVVLHTFNDPITKSTIAVRSDSPAGTLQQKLDATRAAFLNHDTLKFMPDEDPRALKEAALRFPDGQVFTGAMHAIALNDAMEQLYKDDPKGWASKAGNFESGYVTNDGEFLTRQEALQRGKELKQISKEYDRQRAKDKAFDPSVDLGGLESLAFNKTRQFMPEELMSVASQHADTIADHVSSISGEKWSPQEIKAAVALYAKAKQDGEDLSKTPDFAKLIEDAIGSTASAER